MCLCARAPGDGPLARHFGGGVLALSPRLLGALLRRERYRQWSVGMWLAAGLGVLYSAESGVPTAAAVASGVVFAVYG